MFYSLIKESDEVFIVIHFHTRYFAPQVPTLHAHVDEEVLVNGFEMFVEHPVDLDPLVLDIAVFAVFTAYEFPCKEVLSLVFNEVIVELRREPEEPETYPDDFLGIEHPSDFVNEMLIIFFKAIVDNDRIEMEANEASEVLGFFCGPQSFVKRTRSFFLAVNEPLWRYGKRDDRVGIEIRP